MQVLTSCLTRLVVALALAVFGAGGADGACTKWVMNPVTMWLDCASNAVGGGSVGGAGNLTTVNALTFVSAAGTLNEDPELVRAADLFTVSKATLVQNFTDSTTAYQWRDKDGGTPILNIDSTNERVGLGTDAPLTIIHAVRVSANVELRAERTTSGPAIGALQVASNQVNIGSFSNDALALYQNSGIAVYIPATKNVLIGSVDDDGTPATGRLVVKGTTNDGSTNIFVGRDSDEANIFTVNTDGQIDASSHLYVNGAAVIGWTSRTRMNSSADGDLLFRFSDSGDFGRINLGGTTSSFPAIKRDGTAISLRLADDSAYAPLKTGLTSVYNSQATAGVGQPAILGSVSVTGATAAVGATNILTGGAETAGMYRISGYMQTTTLADAACTSDVTIGWTYNSDVKALEVVSNHDQRTDETYSQIPTTTALIDASTNITYIISLDAGGDCTNAVFDYSLALERIQ